MDDEAIKIILDLKRETSTICSSNDECSECSIKAFKVKHNINHDKCFAVHLAYRLLEDNKSTAIFFKDQKKNLMICVIILYVMIVKLKH